MIEEGKEGVVEYTHEKMELFKEVFFFLTLTVCWNAWTIKIVKNMFSISLICLFDSIYIVFWISRKLNREVSDTSECRGGRFLPGM